MVGEHGPGKMIGAGTAMQFFYHNMRRLGNGLKSDPDASIPSIVFQGAVQTFQSGLYQTSERLVSRGRARVPRLSERAE